MISLIHQEEQILQELRLLQKQQEESKAFLIKITHSLALLHQSKTLKIQTTSKKNN